MVLTNRQEEGLRIAVARYNAREPWTCISGYAGTGKSTLVKFIIAALNLNPENVAYVTFTGKAASVLRHKGCPNAMTAHKLLYYSKRLPNGKYIFSPRHTLEGNYSLIVVDEISMLPMDLWQLLLSHKKHIIALGDPFQIPPIDKKQDNHVLDTPHIFLDEIMRQAQESEIIRLTMAIREGKPIEYSKGSEVQVVRENEVVDGMYSWADQIICATNKKRQEINEYMRAAADRGPNPEPGDKIIALRNKWDITDLSGENALVNGTIGILGEFECTTQRFPIYGVPDAPILYGQVITEEDGIFEDVIIDRQALETGKPFLTSEQSYKIWKNPSARPYEPVEFNYGYAITGHKAQGSQWDKVLVFEENFPFDKVEHARWLYTSATRAAEKLVLVR
jgi:exodeoxyribonuclease-5